MSYLESPLASENIEILHIALLSEQLDALYQTMREERRAIAQWEEEQEFSILGVLELFTTEIQGYIEQIKMNCSVTSIDQSSNHLRQLNVFSVDYFAQWYFDNWKHYPQTKQYTEHLDHLRLLVLEHFAYESSIAA